MAITLKQAPKEYAPVYNPIEWIVDSDNNTEDSFKYVADVYVSRVTTPAYFRLKIQADPTYGYGVFDVHRILENYLSSNIDKDTYGFQKNDKCYVRYDIKFGEEYDDGGITVFPNLLVNTDNFVFNGALEFLDWKDYDETDFLIFWTNNRFLTDGPKSLRKIRNGADAWVSIMWNTATQVNKMRITTYDENDSLVQTVEVKNNFTDIADYDQRFLRFSAGPNNLNLIPDGDLTLGSQPIITTSIQRYTLRIFNEALNSSSENMEFLIDYECTKHTIWTVHFLNKLGGFDTFSFIRLSRRTADINRTEYKKNTGTLNADGTLTYTSKDRGIVTLDTSIEDSVIVNSDWLTEAESIWLQELITSPEVYYDDGTELIPVNIRNTSYERKKRANDVLFNYEMQFKFGHIHSRQRG